HTAGRVFARDEPPLSVVGEAVGHIARPAKGRDAVLPAPPADVAAGDVGEEKELLVGVPEWAFGEEISRTECLKLDIGANHGCEAPVANLDVHRRSPFDAPHRSPLPSSASRVST